MQARLNGPNVGSSPHALDHQRHHHRCVRRLALVGDEKWKNKRKNARAQIVHQRRFSSPAEVLLHVWLLPYCVKNGSALGLDRHVRCEGEIYHAVKLQNGLVGGLRVAQLAPQQGN
jgi:hypothetical protein